jgi:hypothetical protein
VIEAQRDRTRARRAAALALHPDIGGDAAEFTAAMAAIDRRFDDALDGAEVLIRRSRLASTRRLLRRTRGRLPRGRRYITLNSSRRFS